MKFTVKGTAELVGREDSIYALRLPFKDKALYYFVEIYSLRPDPRNTLRLSKRYRSEVTYSTDRYNTPRLIKAVVYGNGGVSKTFRLCNKIYKSIVSIQ